MREHLDAVDPHALRRAFKALFAARQPGKGLEGFTWLGHHLLSVDGAGYFFSHTVHCGRCCEKRHRDWRVTHHQMLGAVLVRPQRRCILFRAAQGKAGRAKCFRERLRSLFLEFLVPDWKTLCRAIAFGHRTELASFDIS